MHLIDLRDFRILAKKRKSSEMFPAKKRKRSYVVAIGTVASAVDLVSVWTVEALRLFVFQCFSLLI
jgi:hypothetical protein